VWELVTCGMLFDMLRYPKALWLYMTITEQSQRAVKVRPRAAQVTSQRLHVACRPGHQQCRWPSVKRPPPLLLLLAWLQKVGLHDGPGYMKVVVLGVRPERQGPGLGGAILDAINAGGAVACTLPTHCQQPR